MGLTVGFHHLKFIKTVHIVSKLSLKSKINVSKSSEVCCLIRVVEEVDIEFLDVLAWVLGGACPCLFG